jgi:hypothetical protein
MNEPEQLFSASLAKDAVYKPGLRSSFIVYSPAVHPTVVVDALPAAATATAAR